MEVGFSFTTACSFVNFMKELHGFFEKRTVQKSVTLLLFLSK